MTALLGLAWPLAAAFVSWLAHKHGERFWEHKVIAKQVTDLERLTRLENEVRGLIQAQNLKGLR